MEQIYNINCMSVEFSSGLSNKKFFVLAIALLLLFTPISSFAQSNESQRVEDKEILQVTSSKISETPSCQHVQVFPWSTQTDSQTVLTQDTSILPTSEYPIQHHPRVIGKDEKVFVLSQTKNTNNSTSQLTATYSLNHGETWNEQMTIADQNTSFKNASIDATGDPDMQVYGSHRIDNKTGVQLIFGFPNMTDYTKGYMGSTRNFDMNGWFNGKLMVWEPTYWQEIGNTATAGYPHGTQVGPYKNFHGLTVWAGHDGNGWSYYYFCDTDETQDKSYKILWKNYLNGTLQDVDIDIDISTGWQYDIYQLKNETTGKPEIYVDTLYIEPGNPEWYNKDENYGQSHVFKNYQNPDIKASNGFAYLACEKNNDIFLHYSKDNGFSFDTIQLTNTVEKESNPTVTAEGNVVTVSYVQNNNVIVTSSSNAGMDWNQPNQVNDQNNTVSQHHDEIDIDENNIVWTNTEMNSHILYDILNIETPILSLNSITGGLMISSEIENKGVVNATNIPYSIQIDGGILFSPREISGTISIPAGETRSIQTEQLIIGIGRPTITVNVGSVSQSIQASLLFCYLII